MYLGALIVVVVTAPMVLSSCQECREIPDPASLVVLSHSPGVGGASPCSYDGTPQVDGTTRSPITINMNGFVRMNSTSHFIITLLYVLMIINRTLTDIST